MSTTFASVAFDGSPPPDFILPPDREMGLILRSAPYLYATLFDLEARLVMAPPGASFITSDNPAFRYNVYCEDVEHSGVTGSKQRGFQVFFPLTSTLLVYLGDSGVYKLGGRRSVGPIVASGGDVTLLNRMQLISAASNVYCSDWTYAGRLLDLWRSAEVVRRKNKPRVNVAVDVDNSDSELIHQYWPIAVVGGAVSFLSVRRNARRIPVFDRPQLTRPAHQAPARDDGGELRTFEIRRRV